MGITVKKTTKIPPWDTASQNADTRKVWLKLDEIHDWWIENRDKPHGQCGYSACANHFGTDWRLTREKPWASAIDWLRKQEDPDPRHNNRWVSFCRYYGKDVRYEGNKN